MKILVTGAIGSHMVDAYLEAGHEVVVVDNLASGNRASLNPAATFYEVDIRSPEMAEIMEREKPDVVNHHAAHIDVRRSVADPLYDASINIVGSISLLELCRKIGVKKIIYISSGGAMYGEPEYLPCDESHPVKPLSPYGASKHTVEHYCYMYRENFGLSTPCCATPTSTAPGRIPMVRWGGGDLHRKDAEG